MDDAQAKDIQNVVKALVIGIAPNLQFLTKYGGQVFVPDASDPKTFVGGVFAYKGHVSVEFSDGATFDDPVARLEGKGKARRHLKLHAVRDIEDKDLAGYIRQALA